MREKLNSSSHTDRFAVDHFPEHDVLAIEMARGSYSNKELTAVGIWASIRLKEIVSIAGREPPCSLQTMDKRNGLVWLTGNASSSNFSP